MQFIDASIGNIGSRLLSSSTSDYIENKYGFSIYKNQEQVFETIINPLNHFIVVIEARGGGKTFSVSLSMHYMCSIISNLKIGIFAPKYGQSKNLLKQIWNHDKKTQSIDKSSSSSIHIVFKNGSEIIADSAHEKANVEGGHFHCIVIDEAHKTSDYAISNKIMPMLGSFKHYQIIKIGVALFKNNFYKSFLNDDFIKIKHDWLNCDILKNSGVIEYDGIQYPKFVVEIMPWEKKLQYFKEKAQEMTKQSELSLVDFITQYELTWLENIENFLSEKQIECLASGTHKELEQYDNDGIMCFGLDTASGTINPNTLETDATALAIWKFKNDKFFKVAAYEWRDSPMNQFEEIKEILKRFKCVMGFVDYSNIGIAFIDMLKRGGIMCDGIMYKMTDPKTHKNYKIAMFEYFQDNIIEKIRYPKIYDKDKRIIVSETMYKSFIEWTIFERHKRESGEPLLTSPQGEHDDHCLSKNTLIPLCNGQLKSIEDLSKIDFTKESHYVYSVDESEFLIQRGKIRRCWSKGKQKVIKVIFDNDEYLECTKEHLIMLRNGLYMKAQDIKVGDSLMPLYRKEIKGKYAGYEMIYDIGFFKGKKHKAAHKLFLFGRNKNNNLVVHHKVKAIINEGKEIEVYDMEIENYHNFAIQSGIFVHNCNADVLALYAFKRVNNSYTVNTGIGFDFFGSSGGLMR
jgi:hypothetical protein